MFNIPKFHHSPESKWFVVSDLHYHHEKLRAARGFDSLDAHNKAIIDNWNSVVDGKSTVFVLGDTVLGAGEKSEEVFKYLLEHLNYKDIYLMGGNHVAFIRRLFNDKIKYGIDNFYRLSFNSKPLQKLEMGIGKGMIHIIPNYYEAFVNHHLIVLSHYSILSWRDMSKGSWHCFGHSHNSLSKNKWVAENYLTGKCLDVGFEAFGRPISFDEIKVIMDAKKVIEVDHHNKDTNPSI